MLKNFLLVLLVLFIIIPGGWSIYAYLYLRISESEARSIALNVIKNNYSTICGGNFEKNLTLKIDTYNAKYEFYSYNDACNIFIFMNEFGNQENGIMENTIYSNSGFIIIEPHK